MSFGRITFRDLLDRDDFDLSSDIMCAAKVEHILRPGDAADNGAGEIAAAHQQAERGDGHHRRADFSDLPRPEPFG